MYTPYFLLPTSYFLLPTPYSLLPTSYFLLPTDTSAAELSARRRNGNLLVVGTQVVGESSD